MTSGISSTNVLATALRFGDIPVPLDSRLVTLGRVQAVTSLVIAASIFLFAITFSLPTRTPEFFIVLGPEAMDLLYILLEFGPTLAVTNSIAALIAWGLIEWFKSGVGYFEQLALFAEVSLAVIMTGALCLLITLLVAIIVINLVVWAVIITFYAMILGAILQGAAASSNS